MDISFDLVTYTYSLRLTYSFQKERSLSYTQTFFFPCEAGGGDYGNRKTIHNPFVSAMIASFRNENYKTKLNKTKNQLSLYLSFFFLKRVSFPLMEPDRNILVKEF